MGWKIFTAVYLIGAVLTFGHEAARFEREARAAHNIVGAAVAGPQGAVAALIWPAYWPFYLSWEAFA